MPRFLPSHAPWWKGSSDSPVRAVQNPTALHQTRAIHESSARQPSNRFPVHRADDAFFLLTCYPYKDKIST